MIAATITFVIVFFLLTYTPFLVCLIAWYEVEDVGTRSQEPAAARNTSQCPLCLREVEQARRVPWGDYPARDANEMLWHRACLVAVREARVIYAYLEKR